MNLRTPLFAIALALSASAVAGCKPKGLYFESVNPPDGRLTGGQEVRIRGSGFEKLGNLEVRIGGRPATNVGVADDETIVLTTPEGREADANHNVDVSILTSDGRSIQLKDAFKYQPAASRGNEGPNEDLRRRL